MKVYLKDIPEVVRYALYEVGYTRTYIGVEPAERVRLQEFGMDGQRAYAIVCNLETHMHTIHYGSWGGPNAFCPQNVVDMDAQYHVMPVNGAVIKGSDGGRGHWATLYIHPSNLAKLLPAPVMLNFQEQIALDAIGGLKSGPYRKAALSRVSSETLDALVNRGFLKRSTNGAIRITVEGSNARCQSKT